MFVLNDTTILRAGSSWVDSDGIRHPRNWASAWSADEKAAYGIKEVDEQQKPDSTFYYSGKLNLDGTWQSVEKKLADEEHTSDDGVKTTTLGLKSVWIANTKETANSLLAPSDWQVIAKAERERAIDSNVATYRAAVITKYAEIVTSINACSDLDAFKALFVTPTDSDGMATGNAPIYDWPELGS
tara:strand:+ start:2065 stop:2619 length:555 start_codon:yes stop_codon:yes gene_type:complete